MTPSGILFLLAGIVITSILSTKRVLRSSVLPWLLFFYHLAIALYYWQYTLSKGGDSVSYYKNIKGQNSLGTGTQFVEWLLSSIDVVFSASYLDYFFLFQTFGFLGICLVYMIVREVLPGELSQKGKLSLQAFLFFPNLHFWTSAIGKDSLIFFGITLSIWGLLSYRKRMPALVFGLVLVYFIRPHVAGFFLASVFLALIWGTGISLRWRIIGTILTSFVLILLMPKITEFVGLETVSTQSVGDYLYKRQGLNLEGGSSVNIRDYNVPLKLFTFLFRPLFFDAKGLLWVLVSFENLAYIVFAYLMVSKQLWAVLWHFKVSFFMRFNLFFFLIGTIFFSLSISNMGIAIRQKTMLLPSFMILVIAVMTLKEYQSKGRSTQETRQHMEVPTEGGVAHGVLPGEQGTGG